MPKQNQIIADDQGLILKERPIQITDERLNTILKEIYERARKDEKGCKWYDYYGVLWSSFFTLLLTLLPQMFTVDLAAEKWAGSQWVFVVECIVDFLLFVWAISATTARMNHKVSDVMSERDVAVSECLDRNFSCATKV